LIRLSSIAAPGLKRIEPQVIEPGSFVGVAYAQVCSDTPGSIVASAVALGHSIDDTRASVIMEVSGEMLAADAESIAKQYVNEAMSNRGLEIALIETAVCEHRVDQCGCAFAGVVEL